MKKESGMLRSIFNAMFGCTHRRTTFPLTPARRGAGRLPGSARSGAYVVCLDCGREFGYNWDEMRVGDPVSPRVAAAATQTTYSAVQQ
jgi:hypothetical protein